MSSSVTFVCISDTHGLHETLSLPPGDVLLHAGDLTVNGTLAELQSFAAWWHRQPYIEKFVVAGNHDRVLDAERSVTDGPTSSSAETEKEEETRLGTPLHVHAAALLTSDSSAYLLDRAAATQLGSVVVWGSPWTPRFWGAFQADRGDAIAAHWAAIPAQVDVIITHCPAAGHRDWVPRVQEHVGCSELRKVVLERRPAVHLCGHIHEGGGGVSWEQDVAFVNAALCGRGYAATAHMPVVFSLTRTPGAEPEVSVTFEDPAHRREKER